MKPTANNANTASTAKIGLFALLGGLFSAKGTGAPFARSTNPGRARTHLRRTQFFSPALVLTGLLFTAAPALAAALEAPRTEPASSVTATTATLSGVLSPASSGEVGSTYNFLYKASTTKECKGGSMTSPVESITGLQEEPASEPVTGLKPGTTYAVCLVVHDKAKTEEVTGAAVVFTTLPLPSTEVPSPLGSSTATFKGKLTPLNEEVDTEYIFFYNLGDTPECTYETTAGQSPESAGKGSIAKSVSTAVTGLHPNQQYTVCLFSFSTFGAEVSPASPAHFTTLPAPPEVVVGDESASPVKAHEATLNAVVNPNNEKTKYFFEYSTREAEVLAGKGAKVAGGPELENYGGQGATVSTGAVLTADTTYYYRVVAENTQSEKELQPEDGAVESFSTTTPSGEEASAITGTTATLHGALHPLTAGEADAYEFLYKASATECEGENATPYTSASGGAAEAVEAEVAALAPHTQYTFCLRAFNKRAEVSVGASVTFTTSAAGVSAESSSEVGATSTKLTAQIDPGGAETSYYVEYGTSEAYGSSTSEASAGTGTENASAKTMLEGLHYDTLYHYRFVAKNSFGTAPGPDATFTTFAPSVSALPDNRSYELVSNFPAGTGEEAYTPAFSTGYIAFEERGIHTGERPFQAAADGEAVVYPGDTPPTGGSGGTGESQGTEYLATRSAGGGWTQVDLHPSSVNRGDEYQAFSSDLSVGIFTVSHQKELAGGTSEYRDLYSHMPATGDGGEYDPFYASSPPNRSRGGGYGPEGYEQAFTLDYAGGNAGTSAVPAFSHVLFEANDALLTANVAAPGGLGEDPATHLKYASENNLYDRVGAELYLVNVLPDGGTQANASFGQDTTTAEGRGGSNVISADGSRIFWTALESESIGRGRTPKALYARENDTQAQSPLGGPSGEECIVAADACTVQLDAAQGGPESGGGVFWAASSDGSRVFFTDCRNLTADSRAVRTPDCESYLTGYEVIPATGSDLYEYDFDKPVGERLTDLTAGEGETGDVQGVLGASEDGEYVYFVAEGALASNENAAKDKAAPGHDNLYVRHGATTTFVATLSPEDGSEVAPLAGCSGEEQCVGDWQADGGHRSAEVTPDGHGLVFMSNRRLTGYDNEHAGTVFDEVFVYDAPSQVLTCVSCSPSGEPPDEFNAAYMKNPIGGFIPTSRSFAGEQPLVISEDGDRVFFDSGEPLLPTATSGAINVYEWERAGTPEGSCPAGLPGGGCVYLLSSGTDPENSYLIGTDESGDNAFFISRAQLAPADRGDEGDVVYDARVDGVQLAAEAACAGTGCQGVPPAPPIFATPSSVTFNGVGNFSATPAKPAVRQKTAAELRAEKFVKALKACKREKSKKKRTTCEKAARRKYGPAKQASNDRRAK